MSDCQKCNARRKLACLKKADPTLSIETQAGIEVARTTSFKTAQVLALGGHADLIVISGHEASLENLKTLVSLIGGERESGPFPRIRDIKVDPAKTKSIAEGAGQHDAHTDATFDINPPKWFALQYVVNDARAGGRNFFISGKEMIAAMSDEHRAALRTAEVTYKRDDDSGRSDAVAAKILYTREDGTECWRWRYDNQVSPTVLDAKGTQIHEAIAWVKQHIDRCEKAYYMAAEGEIALISNETILHGREALSGMDSPRWVRRAWIG